MSSDGADTRKNDENLMLFESLVFHHHGNAYRSFIRESPITDPLERMSEFIKLNFELYYGIEYTRFTAEARREIPVNFNCPDHSGSRLTAVGHLPSNGGQINIPFEEMLAEDEIKIEISPVTIEDDNDVVEIQHQPIDIKREVISIEDGPEVIRSLPKSGLLSCGQCRTRSGDFWTMVELEEHIKEKHGSGQNQVTLLEEPVGSTIMEPLPTPHPPTIDLPKVESTSNPPEVHRRDLVEVLVYVNDDGGIVQVGPNGVPVGVDPASVFPLKIPKSQIKDPNNPLGPGLNSFTSNLTLASRRKTKHTPTAYGGKDDFPTVVSSSESSASGEELNASIGSTTPEEFAIDQLDPQDVITTIKSVLLVMKGGGTEAINVQNGDQINSNPTTDTNPSRDPSFSSMASVVVRAPQPKIQEPSRTAKSARTAPKTAEDAGGPPQAPFFEVQERVKRRGRPSKKKLREQTQPSNSPIIENKEAVRPPKVPKPLSQDIIHRIVESTKGLTVSLGPRVEVKLKTTEFMQIDKVIDSTTKNEDMAHESPSEFALNDSVRKKRAREGDEDTPRKTSKVEKKSSSISNKIKDKLDKGNRKPGSSTSGDSGSKSSSDANGRGKESITEIADKSAGIPQKSEQGLPSSAIKTPDYSDDPGKREGVQKPICRTRIFNYELGSFNVDVFYCSHNPGELEPPLFPDTSVPFVGQIKPEIVWDYIDKMKKFKVSIEISVFCLKPASVADREGYMTFFTYLSSRNRLGVLGGVSAPIKDVYLLPLDKNTPIPTALLPFHGPGLNKDGNDSLLAIVTRHTLEPPIPEEIKRRISSGVEASALKMRPKVGGFEIKPGDVQTALSGTSGSISGQGKKESPPSDII